MAAQHRCGPEPSAAIWDWRRQGARESEARRRRDRRRSGLRRALAAFAVSFLFGVMGATVPSALVAVAAAAALFLALGPFGRLNAGAAAALDALGRSVGIGLTRLLLTPIFYVMFVPFGALFRRGRRDPLERRLEVERASYWRTRETDPPPAASYGRQF